MRIRCIAMSKITVEKCQELIEAEYPLAIYWGFRIEDLGAGTARVRMPYSPKILRLGGTIAGPALMGLADFTMYFTVLTAYDYEIGVQSVSTNLNTTFFRRPRQKDVVAHGRIQKAGRRMCFLEVELMSDELPEPVAHVTGTYALPPEAAQSRP